MYKKHLLRGVAKGVVKAEDVETKFAAWLEQKEGKAIDHKTKAEVVETVEEAKAEVTEAATDATEEKAAE